MNPNRRHQIIFPLAAFLFMIGTTCDAASYTLAPLLIDRDAAPRDIVNEVIVLSNNTEAKVTLYPTVNDVTVGLEGGVEDFVPPSMSDRTASLASWIELPRAGLELLPGERREVPLTIRITGTAAPGDYHAMIAYAPGRSVDEAMALIRSSDAPTTLINLKIIDDVDEMLRISRFSVTKFLMKPKDDALSFDLENFGDTDLKPEGDVIVYDQRGVERASFSINTQGVSILPGEKKTFSLPVPLEGLFGKYKASLSVRYGAANSALNDVAYFYVFPWQKLALAFAAFIIGALAIALFLHHRYGSAEIDESDEVLLHIRDTRSDRHERDIVMPRKDTE